MIAADILDPSGAQLATVVLHKGKITVRTHDRALEQRLSRFFQAPEMVWDKGARTMEMSGSEAHFEARCRGLIRHGLRARLTSEPGRARAPVPDTD